MPPLRAHTKSRNGCDNCRKRRVKCDEKGPPCSNCICRELDCTYLKVAAARSHATAHPATHSPNSILDIEDDTASRQSNSVSATASKRYNTPEVRKLELMHKFSTETYQSLCTSDSEKRIWQMTIPRMALDCDYLMNGILALASLHIATTLEPSAALVYIDAGLQYHNRSLAPFRAAVDNITPQNCDAVFAQSVVTIAISIALPRLTAAKDERSSMTGNIFVVFELLQGVKKILQVSQPWINLDLFSQGEYWKDSFGELDQDTDSALTDLAALNEESSSSLGAQQHHINKKVISHLRHCYMKFAHSPGPAPILAWLAAVDKGFVDSLQCRQPFSLLILMYWGVLLWEMNDQRWWAHSSGRFLVSELLEALRPIDFRFEQAITWVKQKISF